jgi:hypothetical protein
MSRNSTLESRLVEWAREYGGSRYDDTGWQGISPLYSLMKYHGRPPQGLNPKSTADWTPADDVQMVISELEKSDWLRAQVLRCEYLTPGQPIHSKLQRLRSLGESMGRSTYYARLRSARRFVADRLGIRDDELEMEVIG